MRIPKKKLIFLYCLIITTFLGCQKQVKVQTADFFKTAPIIDGKMDSIWKNISTVSLKNYNSGTTNVKDANDLSSSFKIAWDTSSLYFLIFVIDDIKFDVKKFEYSIDIPQAYNCDCCELFFDMKDHKCNKTGSFDNTDDDSRYSFVYNSRDIGGTFKSREGIVFAQSESQKGYTFEIAIPFKTLGIEPLSNYKFGFEININDNDKLPDLPFYNFDDRATIAWSQEYGTEAWRNTGLYNDIILHKE